MAEDLWKIRERKGMSVTQVSIRSGIPSHVIDDYESGTPLTEAHRAKLAKLLYVDPRDIKLQSTPRPKKKEFPPIEPAAETTPLQEATPPPGEPRPSKEPKPAPPAPVRPGQVSFLHDLARHFHLTIDQMEAEIGKPLAELTLKEARQWIKQYQTRITTPGVSVPEGYRHQRAYLPESVDEFEAKYLAEAQQAGASLTMRMFNGETISGALIGFGPYWITLRSNDGNEITLQKLAIAYYRRENGDTP